MTNRTGITLRLTPADRTALEALQAFTQMRTATPGPGGRCSRSWTRWTR